MKTFRSLVLFACDSFILLCATMLCLLVSHWFHDASVGRLSNLIPHLLVLYACVTAAQLLLRTYSSLWRYAESREYLSLLLAAFLGLLTYELIAKTLMKSVIISFITLTAIGGLWVLGMLLLRFTYRVYRGHRSYRRGDHKIPAAIVGAGAAGIQLLEELSSNQDSQFRVRCFFDDDPNKLGKNVHGIPVRGTIAQVPDKLKMLGIETVFVAIPSADENRRHEILQFLSKMEHVRISTLPSTLELIDRKPMRGQLREVQIEDLLGRPPVVLDPAPVDAFLQGKVVMVTGGGGSIGSELCRQIVKHEPRKLIIVDIYENNAYDIQQELMYRYGGRLDLVVEIASVRDERRVRQLVNRYRPQVLFHAAAHKHVPLMETSPQEAIRNNVFGTLNLVRAADEYGVEKFLLISTDKAVNPTSVMGASKRMCEMVLQSMKGYSATDFVAVRFGNVLGSNGSVVPLFKRQIAAGGPVTLTDKRIIRYFMTIPEAAQLVLQAGAQARKNELFVLNMGQPVKILDLAENLIRLSGYVPYRDIDIIETGLRPGEKLYEELLIASRDIEQTENSEIFIECQPAITPRELEQKLRILSAALEADDPAVIRQALHQVVPTFHEPDEVNRVQGAEVEIPVQQSERDYAVTV
ncbi:polysaccharide biosynthesis protein [uncultured Flavonifractor sp.]|uniref:polysaccharide biosynthesis protein n=1 Tax=uncultured Flavonifractor sp. TaxID=1193534 RepID=UPI0026311EB3|nr:nucleoside-diphosphate sugar epimerase/dehydratase [uncultured Flavonifractor sp.]